ncbi:response regulator transcription factor [Xinfangfangia sp. D13-10-4-6]|uniref:response regulator transcription factor n=1 Tax=Pseudogemmobacter hezensis TaxID=2737662 RepID=UPI00155443C0|nr:response regulator [Pseudogemmobacter hezensis]NPD17510.1 response regulator transcription factor [Pseudogemmobacter hezensis]
MERKAPATPSQETLTVYVVDDDEAIRASLSRSLQKRGYRVDAFASATDFLIGYEQENAGCLILDYGMPGMNGLELQEHMARTGLQVPIIFITGHGGVPESVQAIKAGALDFLEKPFRQSVLIERIEAAFAHVAESHALRAGSEMVQAKFDRLTGRELEIVHHMVANPSETSSKEVGARLGISPRTVDHHRARILEKLQIRSVAELISLAQHTRPGHLP